jgi:hypothetical protein
MLSHIVVKGKRFSKFTNYIRNIKVQRSEKSILGSKSKQHVRLTSTMDIPDNIKLKVCGNQGFEILLKLFFKVPKSLNQK